MTSIFLAQEQPKSIYEAKSATDLWDLAQTEYPPDEISHFFYLISFMTAFYGLFHVLMHLINNGLNKRYMKLNSLKKTEYRTNIIAPVHSLAAVVFAWLAMFNVCGHGQTVFNNEKCFDTPRYLHIWALVNTCGYFVFDTFSIVVIQRTFETIDKQMIGHHIIAFITFVSTLAFMNFTVVFGVVLLFVEVSTTYISIRWLLYTHKQHRTACATFNTIVIFFTFLIGRLVFQIGLLFGYGYPKLIDMFQDESLPWYKVTLIIFMFLALTVSALMNLFWMYLIVAQIKRILDRSQSDFADEISASDQMSQTEGGGAEPSYHGEEQERQPLLFNRGTSAHSAERIDTDEERDVLHISST